MRLELVLEIFFAEQVQAVATNPTQHGVHDPGGKASIRSIEKRAQRGHQQHRAAPQPAVGERLCVPGKERNRSDRSQLEQATFNAPVDVLAGGFGVRFDQSSLTMNVASENRFGTPGGASQPRSGSLIPPSFRRLT